jgi:MFS family permease
MTLPGIWGVERIGRRRLLIIGAIGMCICEFLVAIVGSTSSKTNRSAQSAEVALVCFYISFFAATWGPIAWVITGEIFPLNVRAKAMSLSTASNWLWNWGIAYASESSFLSSAVARSGTFSCNLLAPYLVDSGAGNADLGTNVFYLWGSTCFMCIIFAYFCIPETKGLSLEQVDLLYQNVDPVHSVAYRKRLLAEGSELREAGAAPAVTKDDDMASSEKV